MAGANTVFTMTSKIHINSHNTGSRNTALDNRDDATDLVQFRVSDNISKIRNRTLKDLT